MKPPTPSATETDPGLALVRSIANRDRERMRALFDDEVDFSALTPGRLWRASTPGEVADLVLDTWFAPPTRVAQVASVECTEVAGRSRVDYELRLDRAEGPATVAQTAYYTAADGPISWLQLLCSGIRPIAG